MTLPRLLLRTLPATLPAAAIVAASFAVSAAADTVVPGNQDVQGSQCLGACVDGDALTSTNLYLLIKGSDTPGLRLAQTSGPFTAQSWDVAGNEANFFVRDVTGGSRLPFRIRPGAPTSSVDIHADGNVINAGLVEQSSDGMASPSAADGAALLDSLSSVAINTYTYAGATHIAPSPPAFYAAFGIGSADNLLAPQDVAGAALAAVKALNDKVDALPAPGTGPQGAAGATGAQGPAGAPGPAGAAGSSADVAALEAKVATLASQNAKLSASVKKLSAQMASVRRLMKKH